MRRIRWRVEHYGLDAIMDQRGGRAPQADKGAGTVELLCRLKRDVYPDFALLHFYEYVTEKHGVKVSYNWLRLMLPEAGVVHKEPRYEEPAGSSAATPCFQERLQYLYFAPTP
jgi:transposase